jgi:phosphate transport system substrate-binding protein
MYNQIKYYNRMTNKHLLRFLFIGLTLVIPMNFYSQNKKVEKDSLKIAVATTTMELMKLVEPAFESSNNSVEIFKTIGATSEMVDFVISGRASVAVTTRNIKDYEKTKCPTLVGTPIGRDGLVLSVPASNPLKNLTFAQIRDIWTGKIINWKELGGFDLPIVVIGRTKAYDPIKLFCDFMRLESKEVQGGLIYSENGKGLWCKTIVAAPETDETALKILLNTPGAITYFPLQVLNNYKEKMLAVSGLRFDGVEATKTTIANGTYFIHRTLNATTNTEPKGDVQKFVNFLLSAKGQKLVKRAGFLVLK